MILSKRERYIGMLAGAVLAVLVLSYYVLTPLLEKRDRLEQDVNASLKELNHVDRLLRNHKAMLLTWNEMAAAGLKSDAAGAESQVQHAVLKWAQEAGLNLASVKPERSEQEKQFQKIAVRAVGNGSMSSIGRFVYLVQNASVPVRIADLKIETRKEGADDLTLQVAVSTLYVMPDSEKPRSAVATVREER